MSNTEQRLKEGQVWLSPAGERFVIKSVKQHKDFGTVVHMDTDEETGYAKDYTGFYPMLGILLLKGFKQAKFCLRTPEGKFLEKVHDTELEAIHEASLITCTYGWVPEIVEV